LGFLSIGRRVRNKESVRLFTGNVEKFCTKKQTLLTASSWTHQIIVLPVTARDCGVVIKKKDEMSSSWGKERNRTKKETEKFDMQVEFSEIDRSRERE
jgi:hypothetical protein